jgi:hypothetical protein
MPALSHCVSLGWRHGVAPPEPLEVLELLELVVLLELLASLELLAPPTPTPLELELLEDACPPPSPLLAPLELLATPVPLELELLEDECPPPAPLLGSGIGGGTHPTVAPTPTSAAHNDTSLHQCIAISSLQPVLAGDVSQCSRALWLSQKGRNEASPRFVTQKKI